MMEKKPRLVFVSPLFLFPNDAGGKIRTTNILRQLKGGFFEIVLVCPATPEQLERWQPELQGVCDELVTWLPRKTLPRWRRAFDLFDELPVNVVSDRTREGREAVERVLSEGRVDLLLIDFVHAAVLMPERVSAPCICFTHNVEAEIFGRHAQTAESPLMRRVWAAQHRKMLDFEARALNRFDTVIAVSERDAAHFGKAYGVARARAIPTGVDPHYYHWQQPTEPGEQTAPTVVFTGSMDSAANIDGVSFFLKSVWPLITQARPHARFLIVGRSPAASLVQMAARQRNVELTGAVDDVRPYVHGAHAFVIPLQVGGGTRIKAFEGMAMGCPVVSTTVGIEGLEAEPGKHYLRSDEPADFANAVLRLLEDSTLRNSLSAQARALVEGNFGQERVGRIFEQICVDTLQAGATA